MLALTLAVAFLAEAFLVPAVITRVRPRLRDRARAGGWREKGRTGPGGGVIGASPVAASRR